MQGKRKTFKRIKRRAGFAKPFTPQVMRKSLATNMFINGCDLDSIRNQLGHASVLTTLIYIKATPKIHKAKYDAYCPLYKDSQRTAEALIIRQITRDPLNVVASHQPRPLPLSAAPTTVIDIEARPTLAPPPAALLSTGPTAAPLTVQASETSASAANDEPKRRGRRPSTKTATESAPDKGKAPDPQLHTFQISLFDDDPQKLVLMSDALDVTAAEPVPKLRLPRVTPRQRLALVRMHETGEPMTNVLYRTLNDVTRNVAHDDLVDLCKRGIVQSQGVGRGVRYWLPVEEPSPTSVFKNKG